MREKKRGRRMAALLEFASVLALAGVLSAVAPASAVLITDWSYTASALFVSATDPPTHFINEAGPDTGFRSPTKLAWGIPFPGPFNPGGVRSSLEIAAPVAGPPPPLMTDGPLVPGPQITHNNFTIIATSSQLQTTRIIASVALTTLLPAVPSPPLPIALPPIGTTFDVRFLETPDHQNLDGSVIPATTCADGSAPVAGFAAGHGCKDIFVISGVLINAGGLLVSPPFPVLGPELYQVTLKLSGFGPLSAAECLAAGAPVGCKGFTTDENKSNLLTPEFGITTRIFTPEPGTLALLGIGLVGLAGAARIRRK